MLRATLTDDKPESIFRLSCAAKGLLCALLFLFAPHPAQAYEVHFAPTFTFRPGEGHGLPIVDSFEQALADYQAHYAWADQTFGGTRTMSDQRPVPGTLFTN